MVSINQVAMSDANCFFCSTFTHTPISAIYKLQNVNVKERLESVFFGIVSDTKDIPSTTH